MANQQITRIIYSAREFNMALLKGRIIITEQELIDLNILPGDRITIRLKEMDTYLGRFVSTRQIERVVDCIFNVGGSARINLQDVEEFNRTATVYRERATFSDERGSGRRGRYSID